MIQKKAPTLCFAMLGIAALLSQMGYVQAADKAAAAPVAAVAAEIKPVLVSSVAELSKAVSSAKAGSTILLADGTYSNEMFTLNGKGSEGKPITISAQTPGKVRFTGESGVKITGEWLVFSGFIFTDGNPKSVANPKETREAIELEGQHNRVTEVAIIDYSKNYISAPGTKESEMGYHKWVGISGQYNRVDHSVFKGKKGGGTLMVIWRETDAPDFHRIDHNQFLDVDYGYDKNGWETIRLGTSQQSQSASNSIVENNYFEHCDGEVEIISNKSGGNIIRNNTIIDSRGAITLRHGSGVIVENNVIIQKGLSGKVGVQSGGIRVADRNHVIRNNYVEGARAFDNHIGGIALMAHEINAKLNGYWEVANVKVENNTIVNSSNSLLIGSSRGNQLPSSATFTNNVFCSNLAEKIDAPLITAWPKAGESKITFTGNTFCADALGIEKEKLGDANSFSKDGIEKVDGFWIAKDSSKGFRPIKMTKIEDAGPTTYKP